MAPDVPERESLLRGELKNANDWILLKLYMLTDGCPYKLVV
jgi:hypothetical protein